MGSSERLERCVVPMLGTRNQSLNGSCESPREGSVGTSNAGAGRSQAEQQVFFCSKFMNSYCCCPHLCSPTSTFLLEVWSDPPSKKKS